jgi:phospholipase B1
MRTGTNAIILHVLTNRLWLDTSVTLMGQQVMQIARNWQAKKYTDFNVIYQPFSYYSILLASIQLTDLVKLLELPINFLSDLDCFHPSLLAHQQMAIAGWNR